MNFNAKFPTQSDIFLFQGYTYKRGVFLHPGKNHALIKLQK